jgi:6-phosphofructokinase 2
MKILTLTANLLAEFTGEYPALLPEKTQRARSVHFQVGGKGINVAKAARRLGVEAEALYLAGGPMGDLCEEWLSRQAFGSRAVKVLPETRAGWVVRAPGLAETTFLGADIPVAPAAWEGFLAQTEHTPATHLALCGSVPGWSPAHTASTARLFTTEPAPYRALDTYGPPLADLWKMPWDLIKINRQEFDGLLATRGSALGSFPDALPALAAASKAGSWIVTDGGGPVYLWTADGGLRRFTPPSVEEVSPTGSGDVFLGVFLARLSLGDSPDRALPIALHHAALNAGDPGVAAYPLP